MKRVVFKVLFIAAVAYVVARLVDWQQEQGEKRQRSVSKLTRFPVASRRWIPSLVTEDRCVSSTPMVQSGIYPG